MGLSLRRVLPALLMAACPGVAAAQTIINCGQTVTGTIVDASTVRVYQFAANAGEAVVVAGVRTSFEGSFIVMELRAPNGALLNASGGELTIPNTILTMTGVHSIVVRAFTPFEGPSTFNVNLQFSTGRCAQPIACGETLSPVIAAPAEQDAFWFEGNADEAVVVATMEQVSPQPSPALQLYGPDGLLLGETNFFTPSTHSLVLPVTGRYTIVTFSDFFRAGTGQYALDLQFTTGRCGTPIACGQTPAGTLEVPGAQDSFSFSGNAGEAIFLLGVPTTMALDDLRIDLYDPSGTDLDLVFIQQPLVLPVSGTYTAVLHDNGWEDVGSYRVSLQFTTGRCATPIACGQTINSAIDVPVELDAYSFAAALDDWFALRVEATSPPLVAQGSVYVPAGGGIAGNTPSEPGVVFTTANGDHTILVNDFELTGTGSYQLRLDCLEASISSPVVTEGGGSADFTVTLATPSVQTLRMRYFTFDGTALAHLDYAPLTGELTFTPGATTGTVTVPVIGDALDEPNERFHLSMGWTPWSSDLGSVGTSTATILDDDGQVIPLLELDHGTRIEGNLAAGPGPVADQDLYILDQRPLSSYEVVVDGTSGDVGGPAGLVLERIEPDLTTVIQSSQPTGTGPSRSLRWQNLWTGNQPSQMVRVRSASCTTDCGSDDVYRLRFYDTTYSIPRFNNSGTQATVLLLQNPGNVPVTALASFWSPSGALLHQAQAVIAPRGLATLITQNVPQLAGQSGSITISNDAPYGTLAGKAVAVEPGTGLAFDSPMTPRPVR